MVDLLVKNKERTHKDPVMDKMRYKKGNVVGHFPDGKLSDHATAGDEFFVIRAKDLTPEKAEELIMNSETDRRIKSIIIDSILDAKLSNDSVCEILKFETMQLSTKLV